MRRILASAILALILAGGIVTFIASSNVAQAGDGKHCIMAEGEHFEDGC
jgi:hypothetical protein